MPDSQQSFSRRQFIQAGAAMAAAASGAVPLLQGAGDSSRRRPNILYVFSDMQRASSLGCYGDPNIHTPTLDAFARQGARFDAAISNTPVCCPHRACLMTGLYGHHHGVVSNMVHFRRECRGLAEDFRDSGYATGYTGKWHIPGGYGSEGSMPLGFPRDHVADRKGTPTHGHYVRAKVSDAAGHAVEKEVYKPTLLTDETIRFIEEKSKGQSPWLFFLSWLPPHPPYAAPSEFRKRYEGKLQLPPNVVEGPSAEYARECLPDYYGMVESLDVEFKRILDALQRAGVAEDTIVCYSSDHGDMLGCQACKAKRWPYEESARVPFLMRYPRAIPAGRVIADPFSTVDVYPTLASLAGLKPSQGLDGLDYARLVTGASDKPPRDYAFLQMMYAYVPWPGWRALRTRQYTYARKGDGPWLLYHTAQDPFQLNNLVGDPASRALVKEMDQRLATIMKESGDSWDIKATTGDIAAWVPGGPKARSQDLGALPAGSPADSSAKETPGGGKKSRKRKKKASSAAAGAAKSDSPPQR